MGRIGVQASLQRCRVGIYPCPRVDVGVVLPDGVQQLQGVLLDTVLHKSISPDVDEKGARKDPRRKHTEGTQTKSEWSGYLTPTTSLTFSVKGLFSSSCSLLRRSWSSCRWRASSSISLLSVILRASSPSSRSFLV